MNGHRNGSAAAHEGPDQLRVDVYARDEESSPLLGKADNEDGVRNGTAGATPRDWEADFVGIPWYRKPSIWWLLPGYAVYSIAFGGIIVPKLNLVLTLVCRKYITEQSALHPGSIYSPVIMFANNPQCRIPEVQALATEFTLYISLITGILSAAVSPKIGALSDRYGRKNFLAFAIVGGLMSEIVTILAATYPDRVHYQWLLFGAFLDGMCGSFGSAMAMTHSYAADVTNPASRGVAFGYFHGALFGGIALGPLLAAYVSSLTGSILSVFWIALVCHLTVFTFLVFLAPESLSPKRQRLARERHKAELASRPASSASYALRSANLLAPLKILYPTGPGSSPQVRTNLVLLSSVNTLVYGVAIGTGAVIIFYTNYAFDWGDFETQMFVGVTSGFRVLLLVAVLPLLTYVFRTRYENAARLANPDAVVDTRSPGADLLDLSMIRGALIVEVICYVGFSVVRHGGVFFLIGVLSSGGGIAAPVLQSALSKHVTPDRVGQLLGAIALLNGLSRVVFPAVFGLLYAATVATFPQTVFVVLCVTFMGAAVLSWFVVPHVYLEDEGIAHSQTEEEEYADLLADELIDDAVVGH